MVDDYGILDAIQGTERASNVQVSREGDFVDDVVRRKSEELPQLRLGKDVEQNSDTTKNRVGAEMLHDSNISWKKKVIVSPEVKSAVGKKAQVPHAHHSWAKRIYSKVQEIQNIFGLEENEELLDSFMCALRKKILLQGRMYVFTGHVCFSSSLFGYHKLKAIPMSSILSLRKMKNVGFPNSLEIVWKEGDSIKKEFFTSFLSREEAFKLILSLWEGSICTSTSIMKSHNGSNDEARATSQDEDAGRSSGESSSPLSAATAFPEVHQKADESLKILEDHEVLQSSNYHHGSQGEILTPRLASKEHTLQNTQLFTGIACAQQAPPVPSVMQKVMEYSLPVHPEEFYNAFLSSQSDFFVEFHAAQGHKNIELTPWDEHSSMGPVRDLSFITVLKGFRIGPSEALCHQTQRVGVYEGSHTVFETSQVMSDIPYGDHFKVETRWDIFPQKTGSGSTLIIHIAVPFTKNTMWKKFIEKGVTESLLEAYQMFRRLADQTLARIGESGQRSHSGSLRPEDLLPQQEEDWDMILGRVEPKFRGGLASLRKMQQELAQQNKFSLAKPQHRRNTSIINSDLFDAIMPSDEEDMSPKISSATQTPAKKPNASCKTCPTCLQSLNREYTIKRLVSLITGLTMIVVVQFVIVWRICTHT